MKTYILNQDELDYLRSNLQTAMKNILPVKSQVDIDGKLSMAYDLITMTAGALDIKSFKPEKEDV